jgi:hypothetical protein
MREKEEEKRASSITSHIIDKREIKEVEGNSLRERGIE